MDYDEGGWLPCDAMAEAMYTIHDSGMTGDYGGVVLRRNDDGTVIVVDHGDLIGVSTVLIAQQFHDSGAFINDEGFLVCDTAGEYLYRPVRFAENGQVVVCERVKPVPPPCDCRTWATHLNVGYPNGHHPVCEDQSDREVRARWDRGEYWRRDDAD